MAIEMTVIAKKLSVVMTAFEKRFSVVMTAIEKTPISKIEVAMTLVEVTMIEMIVVEMTLICYWVCISWKEKYRQHKRLQQPPQAKSQIKLYFVSYSSYHFPLRMLAKTENILYILLPSVYLLVLTTNHILC